MNHLTYTGIRTPIAMGFLKRNITGIFACVTILIGLISLIGLTAHYTLLLSDPVDIKFNTSLAFILSGIALFLLNKPSISPAQIIVAKSLSAVVFIIGLLTLSQYLFHFNAGIDELFWKDKRVDPDVLSPGRMTWISAFNFSVIGVIFYLLKSKKWHAGIQVFVSLLIPGILQVVLNYSFGTEILKFIPQVSQMSILATCLYILLFIGIVFSYPFEYLHVSFYKKLFAIFGVIVLAFVFIFYAMEESNANFFDTVRRSSQTQERTQIKNDIYTLARDIETSTMRYLITGNESSLVPYYRASVKLKEDINLLKGPIRDKSIKPIDFDSLEELIVRNVIIRDKIIAVRKSKGFEEAKKLFDMGLTKKSMDRLINALADFEKSQYDELKRENLTNQKEIHNFTRIIKVFQVIIVYLLLLCFVIIYKNFRNKNKAIISLNKSEQFIRAIINRINNPVSVRDLSGNYMLVNNYYENILNKPADQIVGKHISQFFPEHEADLFLKEDQEVITGNTIKKSEQTVSFDGQAYYYFNTCFPLPDERGNVYAVGTLSIDITEIKQTQQALASSNKHLESLLNGMQQLLDTSLDVICLVDNQGRFVRVSSACEKLWGYTVEELTGTEYISKVYVEDIAKAKKIESALKAGNTVDEYENRYKRKDGTWVNVIWTAIWSKEDQIIYAIARDGTEKRMTLENLQKNRQLLLQAEEMAHVGSWELDLISGKSSWSDEFYRICGLVPGSVEPGTDSKLSLIHPDVREKVKMEMQHAIETGGTYKLKKRIIRPDGTTRVILSQGRCVVNKDGRVEKMVGIYFDITEREENEQNLVLMNRQLRGKAKELKKTNEELEKFAFAASHDMQEPLRMVSSFMSLLEEEIKESLDDTTKQYFDIAIEGAERMQLMITNLLNYSRIGQVAEAITEVDCHAVMKKVEALLELEIQKKNARLTILPLPVIKAIEPKMLQLFQNLVGNAIKYNDKIIPQVEIGCTDEGKMWRFYVKDNGIGISPNYFDKIFEIFQRLHVQEEYTGSGIGLSLCKKIVETCGGKIWVASEEDKGSTFYFTIPKMG